MTRRGYLPECTQALKVFFVPLAEIQWKLEKHKAIILICTPGKSSCFCFYINMTLIKGTDIILHCVVITRVHFTLFLLSSSSLKYSFLEFYKKERRENITNKIFDRFIKFWIFCSFLYWKVILFNLGINLFAYIARFTKK